MKKYILSFVVFMILIPIVFGRFYNHSTEDWSKRLTKLTTYLSYCGNDSNYGYADSEKHMFTFIYEARVPDTIKPKQVYLDSFDDIDRYRNDGIFVHSAYDNFRNLFIDEMSNSNGLLKYYPLYHRESGEVLSFVLISAGADGKIDNSLTYQDTLYLDDWYNKLKLYNKNYPHFIADKSSFSSELFPSISNRRDIKYSLYEYLFGGKDYALVVLEPLPRDLYFKTIPSARYYIFDLDSKWRGADGKLTADKYGFATYRYLLKDSVDRDKYRTFLSKDLYEIDELENRISDI